jgi:predicted phage terminase large subunit-like protein
MEYVHGRTTKEWNALTNEIKATKGKRRRHLRSIAERELMPVLLDWGQHFFPDYFYLNPSGMHRDVTDTLQWMHTRRGEKRAWLAPRSGAKTTWVSKVYPLFCICHGLESYIQLVADASEQACENLGAIRVQLDQNEALAIAYPKACGVGPRWNANEIVTRNGIRVHAVGKGKKVRGRSHGSYRPTLQIVDDLENDQEVESPQQRRKVINWLNRALLPAGAPQTNVLFIGTALHPEDALQTTIKTPGWNSKTYKALIREPDRQDLWDEWRKTYRDVSIRPKERERVCRELYDANRAEMDRGAILLWPEREPLYQLMRWRETNGELAFQSEKQGNAAATGAVEFPPEFFPDSIYFETWPDLVAKAMALDPSKGINEKNDFSAYVIAGLGTDGNIYIDANLERRDAMKVVTDGIRLYREHQPHTLAIESMMFQELFQHMFRSEAQRLGMVLSISPVHQSINKGVRIRELTPFLWGGQLKFKAGSIGVAELVKQLKTFPTGEHDDGPDALHMAIGALTRLVMGDSGIDKLSVATG